MDITVLNKKQKINVKGEDYYDLSENSYLSDNIYDAIIGVEVVQERHAMRIDLISLKWYGTTKNVDIILKANNIFNPFTINAEDLLIIPAIKADSKLFTNKAKIKNQDLRKNYIDTARLSENDIKILKNLSEKNKNRKNKLKNPTPPNMLPENRTNKTLDENGNLVLTNHHLK